MIQIIPAILSEDIEEVRKKIELVTGAVQRVHIDIMDETLVPNKTVTLKDLYGIYFPMELHMMVMDPLKYLEDLKYIGPARVIIHQEIDRFDETFSTLKKEGFIVTVAQRLESYLPLNYNNVLLMAVELGYSGNPFSFEVIQKIKQLRMEKAEAEIEVDGGIDDITAKACRVAGADAVAINHYLFKEDSKEEIVNKIQKLSFV